MNTSANLARAYHLSIAVKSLMKKGFESTKVARMVAKKIMKSKGKYTANHFVKSGPRAGLLKKAAKKAAKKPAKKPTKKTTKSKSFSIQKYMETIFRAKPKTI